MLPNAGCMDGLQSLHMSNYDVFTIVVAFMISDLQFIHREVAAITLFWCNQN